MSAVGTGEHVEFTALGDEVNVTARLATAAGSGEILVTEPAVRAAQLSDPIEWRSLLLKGRSSATEVGVLTLAP